MIGRTTFSHYKSHLELKEAGKAAIQKGQKGQEEFLSSNVATAITL